MPKIEIKCKVCKKPFFEWEYRNRKYCSNECKNIDLPNIAKSKGFGKWMLGRKSNMEGKHHSEMTKQGIKEKLKGLKPWNTGKKLTEEHKENISRTHITTESSYYRKKAYKVYGKVCQRCGSEKFICVHHKDENRKNNKIENLEVVCKGCHLSHHKPNKK